MAHLPSVRVANEELLRPPIWAQLVRKRHPGNALLAIRNVRGGAMLSYMIKYNEQVILWGSIVPRQVKEG
jgi:hypothetical protein